VAITKPYKFIGGTIFAPGEQKQEKERGERGMVFYWLSLFDVLLVVGELEVGPPWQIKKNCPSATLTRRNGNRD